MLDRVVCSREHFSFQMCLEHGDGSGTFEFQTAGAVMLNASFIINEKRIDTLLCHRRHYRQRDNDFYCHLVEHVM